MEMHMSSLKGFQFASLPQRAPENPIVRRREKLIVALEKQAALLKDPNFRSKDSRWAINSEGGKELVERTRRIRPWWFQDADGKTVMTIRYGAKPIEFEKGKAAIAVGTPDKLDATIRALIAAVRDGAFDALLSAQGKARAVKRAA